MKILSVKKHQYESIETDDPTYPDFRRYPNGVWENLMGESWEQVTSDDLEVEYQAMKLSQASELLMGREVTPPYYKELILKLSLNPFAIDVEVVELAVARFAEEVKSEIFRAIRDGRNS